MEKKNLLVKEYSEESNRTDGKIMEENNNTKDKKQQQRQ